MRTLSRLPTREEIDTWTAFVADAREPADPPPAPAAGRARSLRGARPGSEGDARQPDPLRGLETRAGGHRESARARAYEDVQWTLLNSSEFVLNH